MSTLFEPINTAEISWREGQPYAISFDDIYFSKGCGLLEAQHVFIDGNQLIKRWQSLPPLHSPSFIIAETGFGSGRNFLLAWSVWKQYAPSSARLHFISCEKHPLSREDLSTCFSLWPELQELANILLDNYPILTPGYHQLQFDEGRVNLTLMLGDVLSCYRELLMCGDIELERNLRESYVDAWFLDGFSPAKNKLMWSEDLFATVGMLSKPGTTLATFTAASVVNEGLKAAGFRVTKKGGYGSKRDMLIAEFERLLSRKTPRSTPWHVSVSPVVKVKNVLVLGAGLAGCYMANALARRGWRVTILDAQDGVACGASGNRQGILFPQLSAFSSPLSKFMLVSYLFSTRIYKNILAKCSCGELSALLQLAYSSKEQVSQANLQAWLVHYPELGRLVNSSEASNIAGIGLQFGGLFVPQSGWFDSPALCKHLIQMDAINLVKSTNITSLLYDGREWHANGHHAEVLVIANGYQANQFTQTEHLPLNLIRGQMTSMVSNEHSDSLQVPLCADGHITPARNGLHALGASYHTGLEDSACYDVDDEHNLAKLGALSTLVQWSLQVNDHWAGIRAATPDYLPLLGPVAKAESFKQQFATLASDSRRWIPLPGVHHDGLYICAGFGSRGLTTIPLGAEWLAATINKEPSCLPRTMIQSFSPARFLRRSIIHMCKG